MRFTNIWESQASRVKCRETELSSQGAHPLGAAGQGQMSLGLGTLTCRHVFLTLPGRVLREHDFICPESSH